MGARFCFARLGVNEEYAALFLRLVGEMERMGASNGLAQMCLQLLGAECDLGEL